MAENPGFLLIQKFLSDITDTTPIFFKQYMMSSHFCKESDEVAGHFQASDVVIPHLWHYRIHWKITKQGHFSAVTSVLNLVIFKNNSFRHCFNWTLLQRAKKITRQSFQVQGMLSSPCTNCKLLLTEWANSYKGWDCIEAIKTVDT